MGAGSGIAKRSGGFLGRGLLAGEDQATGISEEEADRAVRTGSRRFSFLGQSRRWGHETGTVDARRPRFPLPARKSGTFGLRWRGMERRVLSMPSGPSAGITTIRYTELGVPRETISVSRRAESVRVEAESK
jgi:hypothetical protein